MVVLGFVALMGLKPWEEDSVEPSLTLPFHAAVGDAVALGSGLQVSVAANQVAPAGPTLASVSSPEGEGRPLLAVAPAVAVTEAAAAKPVAEEPGMTGTGEETPSDGATDGEAPSDGVSSPVSTPLPGSGEGGPGRPVTAGGPVIESCDGDEYVITVVLVPGEDEEVEGAEEASVEIVLQRFNEDGSVDELTLEGDLLDAQNLAVQLSLEGNCVYLEASTPTEDGDPSDGTTAWEVPSEGSPSSAIGLDPGEVVEAPESP